MRTSSRAQVVALILGGLALSWSGCSRSSPEPEPPEPADPRLAETSAERSGRWLDRPARSTDPSPTAEQQALIEQLEAIGYVGGSKPVVETETVTVHDRARAQPGFNFYTSGHAAEALLRDMEGRLLHRWRHDFHDVWPDRSIPTDMQFWRRAHLFANGDVLAIFEGHGIVKVDKDSNLLWANPVRAHHDLQVMDDGTIWVLTRKGRMIPEIQDVKPILEDFVSVLDADGNETHRLSLLEAFERSPFRDVWRTQPKRSGDIFHTNSIEVLDGRFAGRAPWLKAGNLLLSMLEFDCVAVVDPQTETVVMAWQDGFRKQHDPRILDDGGLLLFDNRGLGEASRVLEVDPATLRPVWSYVGTPERPFYSETCGAAARLPNGNTLITESDYGRAFEVTRDGEIVWEFYNPHRAGAQGQYVAALLEMVRLPVDFPLDWAAGAVQGE